LDGKLLDILKKALFEGWVLIVHNPIQSITFLWYNLLINSKIKKSKNIKLFF
jgi:hypothetical protein